MRQQRADLFERVARSVRGSSRRSAEGRAVSIAPSRAGNNALCGLVEIVAVEVEQRRGRISLEMRPQQFERKPESGVMNAVVPVENQIRTYWW